MSGTSGAGKRPDALLAQLGRPATELRDSELEQQGTQAHATRNWVFLHGTAEQFARHTSRMVELEQEYLRRHPKRTWQGSGGAVPDEADEVTALRSVLQSTVVQLEAALAHPTTRVDTLAESGNPVVRLLEAVAAQPGGRMHKLEVHQTAREAGLDRTALAALYTAAEPVLAVDQHDRVITDAGRAMLNGPL